MTVKPQDDITTKKSAPKLKPAYGLTGKKITKPNIATVLSMMIQGQGPKVVQERRPPLSSKTPRLPSGRPSRSKC